MLAIESLITDQERAQAKDQTLSVIRRKYLNFKAEYLSMDAVGNEKRKAQLQKAMEDCDKSYAAVEAGL